jgi:hypothetical protein
MLLDVLRQQANTDVNDGAGRRQVSSLTPS